MIDIQTKLIISTDDTRRVIRNRDGRVKAGRGRNDLNCGVTVMFVGSFFRALFFMNENTLVVNKLISIVVSSA